MLPTSNATSRSPSSASRSRRCRRRTWRSGGVQGSCRSRIASFVVCCVEVSRRALEHFNEREWDAAWSFVDEKIEWHSRADERMRATAARRAFGATWTRGSRGSLTSPWSWPRTALTLATRCHRDAPGEPGLVGSIHVRRGRGARVGSAWSPGTASSTRLRDSVTNIVGHAIGDVAGKRPVGVGDGAGKGGDRAPVSHVASWRLPPRRSM